MNDNDDMDFMIGRGYKTGIEFMESVTSATIISFWTSSDGTKTVVKRPRIHPRIDNADPDFMKGFNAAVDDYIQDNENINWFMVFNDTYGD